MSRQPFRPLVARLLVDGGFRTEALVLGPEHLLAASASGLERDLIAQLGAAARGHLIDDLLDHAPPPAPPPSAGEVSVPAGAVASNTELSVPAGAAPGRSTLAIVGAGPGTPAPLRAAPVGATSSPSGRAVPGLRPRPALDVRPSAGITPIPIPGAVVERARLAAVAAVVHDAAAVVDALARRTGAPAGDALVVLAGRLDAGADALVSTVGAAGPGARLDAAGRALTGLVRAVAAFADAFAARADLPLLGHAADALLIAAHEHARFSSVAAAAITRAVAGEHARAGEVGRALDGAARLGALTAALDEALGAALAVAVDGLDAVLEGLLSFFVAVVDVGGDPDAATRPATTASRGPASDGLGLALGDGTLGRLALALAPLLGGRLEPRTGAGRVRPRDVAALRLRFTARPSDAEVHRAAVQVAARLSGA